jgi:hypothetical protein
MRKEYVESCLTGSARGTRREQTSRRNAKSGVVGAFINRLRDQSLGM